MTGRLCGQVLQRVGNRQGLLTVRLRLSAVVVVIVHVGQTEDDIQLRAAVADVARQRQGALIVRDAGVVLAERIQHRRPLAVEGGQRSGLGRRRQVLGRLQRRGVLAVRLDVGVGMRRLVAGELRELERLRPLLAASEVMRELISRTNLPYKADMIKALDIAAEMSGWGTPLPEGTARAIAFRRCSSRLL